MNEAIHLLGNDSSPFHPAHSLIRAAGPPDLHHAKGRGPTFAAQQGRVLLMVSDPDSDNYIGDDPADHQASLEDRDYYTQENVFWVPDDARWESLRARAKQPEIGQLIDKALVAIENENPTLRGKLDKRFGAAQLEPGRLSNFDRVLALLREAMVNGPAALNQLEKEGVIQRFESCFELAWKTRKTIWRPTASCLRW